MQAYVGAIWSFGFNFAPVGWAQCNGQLMSIAQNEALYALIGTIYGGDGVTTFGLPNLQGRTPIGAGQGPALPNYVVGQSGGSETVTLTTANLPAHTHPVLTAQIPVSGANGGVGDPTGQYFGVAATAAGNTYASTATPGAAMAPNNGTVGITGNSLPISILNPFLTINYCIAVEGIFPSRN